MRGIYQQSYKYFESNVIMSIGAPLANYLSAKRVGNLLYLSGVIAVDPTTRKVVNAYEDLPMNAQTQLQTLVG